MGGEIEIPQEWARWEIEPISAGERLSADERMVSAGKIVQAFATRKVLERPAGSRLRKRMLTTALRGGFGLTNRRQYDRLLDSTYAEDCEYAFEAFFPDMGDGLHHGREGVKRYLLSFDDALSSLVFEPLEVVDPGGENVAAAVRGSGNGRTSGIPITRVFGIVYSFADGRVQRQESFADWPSAIERLKQIVAERPAEQT